MIVTIERHRSWRDGAIRDAWMDSRKLADACDNEYVQAALRGIHAAHDRATRDGAGLELVRAIEAEFEADPMFDTWLDDAREAMERETD